jgi:hypothetical protein
MAAAMRRLTLLSALLVLAAVALPPATASAKPCGKVDIGFTNATVSGERVTCFFSRTLVRRWLRVVGRRDCNEQNNFCRVTRVRRWRCVQGGSELVVRLRCTAGRKRVRAHWGD